MISIEFILILLLFIGVAFAVARRTFEALLIFAVVMALIVWWMITKNPQAISL